MAKVQLIVNMHGLNSMSVVLQKHYMYLLASPAFNIFWVNRALNHSLLMPKCFTLSPWVVTVSRTFHQLDDDRYNTGRNSLVSRSRWCILNKLSMTD